MTKNANNNTVLHQAITKSKHYFNNCLYYEMMQTNTNIQINDSDSYTNIIRRKMNNKMHRNQQKAYESEKLNS